MKHYKFILTMPGVGSWNGKWTGEKEFYCIVKSFTDSQIPKFKNSYRYRWNDGWCANVNVEEITAKEKQLYKKKSKGFCGYSWMVNSIIKYNEILIEEN